MLFLNYINWGKNWILSGNFNLILVFLLKLNLCFNFFEIGCSIFFCVLVILVYVSMICLVCFIVVRFGFISLD